MKFSEYSLDYIRDELIPVALLEEPIDPWLDVRRQEDVPIIGHTQPYYNLFYYIAKVYSPRFVVELGSYRGTAAAHFAAGCRRADVVTIDIHREDKVAQVKAIEAADHWVNMIYLNGWTWDVHVVSTIAARPYPIDILYIDAWHEYEYVRREWDLYSPLLADVALVICDDIMDVEGATKDMLRFWDELDYDKFIDTRPHCGIPMGFLRYVR